MFPIFYLGPLQFSTFKVLYAIALLVTIAIGAVRLRRHGHTRRQWFEGLSVMALGATIGARSGFALARFLADALDSGASPQT